MTPPPPFAEDAGKVATTNSGAGIRAGVAILWIVLFKVVLDISYFLVRGEATYYALPVPAPNLIKIIESYVLLISVLAVTSKDWGRVSTLFVWILLALSYVPMLTIYAIGPEDRLLIYATTAFWAVVGIGIRSRSTIWMPTISHRHAWWLALAIYAVLCVVSLVVLVVYFGSDLVRHVLTTRVNLSNFYDIRIEFVAAGLPLHGYYLTWLALVFNPAFFVISLLKRRWFFAGLIFLWQLVIAEAVGQRGFVFAVAFAAILAWMFTRRQPARALSTGMVSLIAGGLVGFYAFAQPVWYFFFTGRFLLDGGQLTFDYYHFFAKHGPIPLAYLIKFYLYLPYPWAYPYTQDPSYVVAESIIHQHVAAVGGLIADAYMNFGFAGLVLWAAGIIVLAKLIDASAADLDRAVAVAVLAIPSVALANTYTVRVIFASGLVWSLILLFLLGRSRLMTDTSLRAGPPAPQSTRPGLRPRAHESGLRRAATTRPDRSQRSSLGITGKNMS